MLHVFHLDAGRMLSYDGNFTGEPVSTLQEAISNSVGVAAAEQILLISGGEILEASKKVSSYHAGMDSSNPIYVVCRTELNKNRTVAVFSESSSVKDLEALVIAQQSSSLSPFQTIQTNVQLSKKFSLTCDDDFVHCSQMVTDQHLIHQGWLAVIANLDDTVNAFRQRIVRYKEKHDKFLMQKTKAAELLRNFSQDLSLLKQIPLLNCLVAVSSPSKETAGAAVQDHQRTLSTITLFDWISSKEPESSLNELSEDTRRTLEQIVDSKVVENLLHWETVVLERWNDGQMKEIKGLGRRLDQLNEYFELVKKIRIEQHQYADMIARQEQQATTTRDSGVLSQLCVTQTDVLKLLLANQKKLSDISRRFFEAKSELLKNIWVRLQWVMDTHQIISSTDSKILLNSERLRKIRRQLELLRQLHDAPIIYASAVTEVLRRKFFSREYCEWAERLVSKSRTMHTDENRLRELFADKLDRHFLRSLFQGMDDKAPNFCTELPEPFDAVLPPLDVQHVREIRHSVPQLANVLQVCQPQVYERMTLNETKTETLRRDVSFYTHTPPKYVQQMALNRSCQSPSWMSGDEFSPNTVGTLFHATNSNDSNLASGGEDADSQESQLCDLPCSSIGPRSAPIRIPSRAPSDAMTNSRQFSEKSSRFGTPDEGVVGNDIIALGSQQSDPDDIISASNANEIVNVTRSIVGKVCQMNDALPLVELARQKVEESPSSSKKNGFDAVALDAANHKLTTLQNEFSDKMRLLAESIERETALEKRLKESEEKLLAMETLSLERNQKMKNDCLKLTDEIRQLSTTFRCTFDDIRSSLVTFTENTRNLTDSSSTVLYDCAKKLELNLQTNLAEAQKATSLVQEAEFDRRLEGMKEDLDKERQKLRECQKQLENCEAYLKQKDDVIELLQQQMHDNERIWENRLEEAKSELIKQLTIEHELDLDSLRREYQTLCDNKDCENRHILNELREKDDVIKQMRRDQDRLVASVYEREIIGSGDANCAGSGMLDVEFKRMKEEEFDERVKQIKHEMEQIYKDKLQMLTVGLEQKHVQQMERLKIEKDVEVRLLKEQQKQQLAKMNVVVSSPDMSPRAAHVFSAMSNNPEESYYALTGEQPKEANLLLESVNTVNQEGDFDACNSDSVKDSAMVVSSSIQGSNDSPLSPTTVSATPKSSSSVVAPISILSLTKFTQTRPDLRVSILNLFKGDLILLIYEPKIDCYVAFTVAPTLYVLKEAAAQRMGLQRPELAAAEPSTTAASRDPESKFVFARLTEADYCQVKKRDNRYKLPLGTKFYRISAERPEINVEKRN